MKIEAAASNVPCRPAKASMAARASTVHWESSGDRSSSLIAPSGVPRSIYKGKRRRRSRDLARTDAMVLGAGIVGTSVALHLAKRGISVALVDSAGIGEQTSYGNAGIIEGNTIFPPAFPFDVPALARIAFMRASEANYHPAFLPRFSLVAGISRGLPAGKLGRDRELIRPLFSRAVAEHEILMAEAGAMHYLRKTGWLKIYRGEKSFNHSRPSSTWPHNSGCRCNPSILLGHWRSNRRSVRFLRTACFGRRLRASATRSV